MSNGNKNALILSGGGARAAYQVGVLKALTEILPGSAHNPFPIICGTSAGAINALYIASHPGTLRESVLQLENLWRSLMPDLIYKTSAAALIKSLSRLGFSLLNEGVGRNRPLSLLDNSPLRQLLHDCIRFEGIDDCIAAGDLEAVSITATGYTTGQSVSFFQAAPGIRGWQRHRRIGTPVALTLEHLMASSAIPTIFPAVKLNREYFGDGALRQTAPISPALHLGANRLFIIGVSSNRNPEQWVRRQPLRHSPSMAQIMGQLFSSAFIDALEGDIEHMERINELLALIPDKLRDASGLQLRPVESMIISPSEAVDKIAGRKIRYLSSSLRLALRTVGATAKGGGATAASYLLFAPAFCGALIDLGYKDTMWERSTIEHFFQLHNCQRDDAYA
ncbi:patatin-like phospholipase family protein [Motiliproteus sediminis]|uniref:patatin-like phospholipase family protein n=1 Tax=Motiliproteus sediminis TaxID=1468178 RepID=UPI001AEF5971|nr:patatin-like phospholipase family protein [Motiliproteus sediminis]